MRGWGKTRGLSIVFANAGRFLTLSRAEYVFIEIFLDRLNIVRI